MNKKLKIQDRENSLAGTFLLSVFALLFMLSATQTVYALGVTPGRVVVNFEPGLEKSVTLRILNNEHKDFKAVLFARGELGKYATFAQDSVEFNSGDESKEISYTIKLPEEIAEPGTHPVDIVIRETKATIEGEEASIGYLVSVVSQLYVMVPYPEKYVAASIDIVGEKIGEEVKFYIPIYNLGEQDIGKVKAILYILDRGKKIAEVESNEKGAKTNSRAELAATWKADVAPGTYQVKAVVYYDGETKALERSFYIGEFLLKPLDISVNSFQLGGVAKFNILVENIGNQEAREAYSMMLLEEGEAGKSIANIRSEPITIEVFSKEEMISYWDTEGIEKGIYSGKLVLGYENKTAEKLIRTRVEDSSIETEIIIGITARAITETGGMATNKIAILWWIIIALILANIIWFVYFKRRGK